MVFDPRAFTETAGMQIQGDPRLRALQEGLRGGLETAGLPGQAQAQELKNQLMRTQLQYEEPMAHAKTEKAQADVLKAQILNEKLKGIQSGHSQTLPTQAPFQPPYAPGKQPGAQPQATGQPQTYQDIALTQQLAGMGKPEIREVDGKQIAFSPFGTVEVAQGLTPRQTKLMEQEVKTGGKFAEDYLAARQQQPVLDRLQQITASPVFAGMREYAGIAPQTEMAWFKSQGTPEQKEMAGDFTNSANQYITSSAGIFGARMTDADLRLLQSMKITDKDTLEVAQGKIKAAQYFNQLMSNRSLAANQNFREGMSPTEAWEEAEKVVPTDPAIFAMKEAEPKKQEVTKTNVINGVVYEVVGGKWRKRKD